MEKRGKEFERGTLKSEELEEKNPILNVLKNIRDMLWTKWMPGPKGY